MPLQEHPLVSYPFEKVGLEITELAETENWYKYVLTIVDNLSRY
jgi:hypothetical protein